MPSLKITIPNQTESEMLVLDNYIFSSLERIATSEHKQLQTIIDEALAEYIERKQKTVLRPNVQAALDSSLFEFDELYQELAK